MGVFDTATECQKALNTGISRFQKPDQPQDRAMAWLKAKCVATDDPRLEGNPDILSFNLGHIGPDLGHRPPPPALLL